MSNRAALCALLASSDERSMKEPLSALNIALLLPTGNDHLNLSCCDAHSSFLVDCCLPWLLGGSKRELLNNTQVFDIGRLLSRLVDALRSQRLSLSSEQQTATLKFVWQYWDYSAEVTRHHCMEIFENMLRLHLDDCSICVQARQEKSTAWCAWTVGILETVVNCSEDVRCRYKALFIFATLTSADSLTEWLGIGFPQRLLAALENRSVTVTVCELLCFLLSGASSAQMQLWTSLLVKGLTSDCSWMRASLIERVFPLLFKSNYRLCISLLEQIVVELNTCDGNGRALDARLSVARLRLRFDKSSMESLTWNQLLGEHTLEDALSHADIELRLAAWHVLSDQPKLSQIIEELDFRFITLFLSTNANEQHPAARQKILTGVKKILIRIRESAELLVRDDENSPSIDRYISFLKWLLQFAFDCLREGANIGRRSMGLGILQLIFLEEHLHDNTKSSFFRFSKPATWLKDDQVSSVIAVLDDPFEVCQRVALNVLLSFSPDALSFLNFDAFLEDVFAQLLSVKTRTVFGAAFRLKFYVCARPPGRSSSLALSICRQLIGRVSDRILAIRASLLSIADTQSVYGLLHGVSAVLETETFGNEQCVGAWREFVETELLPVCGQVGELVAPVVHSASPEGFMPPDLLLKLGAGDERTAARVHSRTCQALLVSCWRSQKEMSAIFEQLVQAPFPTVIDHKELTWMSSYYWLQLTECKHFGAFGTAIDGFTRLCEKLWSVPRHDLTDGQVDNVPDPSIWLDDIVGSLEVGTEATKLCTTRRSAGLPHLVCAILATEPKSREGESLDQILPRLLAVADSWRSLDITLCVHALNVLRVVFRDARLADMVASWAEAGLRTAVQAFAADSWSVRNAGSQLLTALLIRVFGVPQTNDKSLPTVSSGRRNCLSAFEFFRRYPSMFDFLLATVKTVEQRSSARLNDEFALFPTAIILARIYPSLEGPTTLSPFLPPLLRIALTSRIEKLRFLATAAIASVSEPDDWLLLIRWIDKALFAENGTAVRQNTVNGALMLLHAALQQNCSNTIVRCTTVETINKLKQATVWLNWCEYNKTLFAEILEFVSTEDDVLLKLVDSAKGSLIAPLGRLLARNLLTAASACWQQWQTISIPLKRAVIAAIADTALTENHQHITTMIIDELFVCREEFTLRKLLKFLLEVAQSSSTLQSALKVRQKCICDLLNELNDASWIIRTSTVSRLLLLRCLLSCEMDMKTIDWLGEATQGETVSFRRAALVALTNHVTNWQSLNECINSAPPICIALLRLLLDEDCLIREQMATVVSSVANRKSGSNRSFNAVICVQLLVKAMQSNSEHRRAVSELECSVRMGGTIGDDSAEDEEDRLFDRSVTNSFAEWFVLDPLFSTCVIDGGSGRVLQLSWTSK